MQHLNLNLTFAIMLLALVACNKTDTASTATGNDSTTKVAEAKAGGGV
jgi:hypothetical protein